MTPEGLSEVFAYLVACRLKNGPATPEDNEATATAWSVTLGDPDDSDLHAAAIAYAREEEWWPTPAALLKRLPRPDPAQQRARLTARDAAVSERASTLVESGHTELLETWGAVCARHEPTDVSRLVAMMDEIEHRRRIQ